MTTVPFAFFFVVTDAYVAVPQASLPGALPVAEMSHARGNGVICESSLYVNQYGLVEPVSVIVTFVGLFATTDFTSSGIPPGA